MKLPLWLLRRFDDRDRIPWWALTLWPRCHWCLEIDGLLVPGDSKDHYCDCVPWPQKWVEARKAEPPVDPRF